jgi:hypothetical protein
MGNSFGIDNWWHELKQNNTLINGPQLGIFLKKDDATVLIFGESHSSTLRCGDGEQFFTNLFDRAIRSPKCDDVDVILELGQNSLSRVDQLGNARLPTLLRNWRDNYPRSLLCKIKIHYGNRTGLHQRALELMTKGNDNKYLIENQIQIGNLETTINMLRDQLIMFTQGYDVIQDSSEFRNLTDSIKQQLTETFLRDMYAMCNENNIYLQRITAHTSINSIIKIINTTYNIGLKMIDFYAIVMVLSGPKNILIYEGVIHTVYIAAYLTKIFNFKIVDVAEATKINCMQFKSHTTKDDIIKNLQSIITVNNNANDNHIKNNVDILIENLE